MKSTKEPEKTNTSQRIVSIDVIRGITILAMIFVNDIAGVHGTPVWMKHMPKTLDGMTFVDLVFPAFLFIVGMSMPFSIGRRLEKKENLRSIWAHILIRFAGLLLLGVFMLNGDSISDQGMVNPHLWVIFMYLSIIVIWNRNQIEKNISPNKYVKYFAIAVLIFLAIVYRGGNSEGIIQMRTSWWGILGLIGWAYLISSIIYIPFRNNQLGILGSIVLLYLFYIADESGALPNIYIIQKSGFTLGTHSAIMLTGVLLGNKMKECQNNGEQNYIIKWSISFSLFLLFAGFLIHSLYPFHVMFIISKNMGTAPWALISSSLTIWIWILTYWLIDLKGFRSWTKIILPAGANPLFAYILAPLVVEIIVFVSESIGMFDIYGWLGSKFLFGLLRALILAFSMTWLAGYLGNRGVRLKL